MPKRIRAVAGMAALVAAVAGCGSGAPRSVPPPSAPPHGQPTAGRSTSPPVASLQPDIPVVRLGASFVPDTLQLGAGQQFVVIVSQDVEASGSGLAGACTPAQAAQFASALLSLRCSGGSYLFTTRQAGSTVLAVTVRPSCPSGSACPQWIIVARLKLTIT